MTNKDAYIRQLENMVKSQEILIKQLQAQIENLTEAVLAMRHDKFGPSSEKTPKSDGNQLSIFNEAELHADETPVQVLKEEGKAPQSKSYMWLYCSGNDGLDPIVLYDYQPSRIGKNAADYMEGFQGYVHSDGYSGYHRLTGITRCGCWAHVRRKFVEAVPKTKASGNLLSDAETGRTYCDRLFMLERELQNLSADERKQERLNRGKVILGEFWSWLEIVNALPGSKPLLMH